MLCQPYLKGRDWFDFSWYVARGTMPNLTLLQAALRQSGQWSVDATWLEEVLTVKIEAIDWRQASADVMRFLRPAEAKSGGLWSARFFHSRLAKLAASITGRIG